MGFTKDENILAQGKQDEKKIGKAFVTVERS